MQTRILRECIRKHLGSTKFYRDRGESIYYSVLLGSWLRPPWNKREIDRRQTNRSLIACIPPVDVAKPGNSLEWLKPPALTPSPAKDKRDVGRWAGDASDGRVSGKHSKQGWVVTQI